MCLLAGLDEFVHDLRPHGTLTGEEGARAVLFAAPPAPLPRARLVAGPYDLQSEGGPAPAHHDDLVAHADHARNPAHDVRRDGALLVLPDPARQQTR
jgi:hypothetical protein